MRHEAFFPFLTAHSALLSFPYFPIHFFDLLVLFPSWRLRVVARATMESKSRAVIVRRRRRDVASEVFLFYCSAGNFRANGEATKGKRENGDKALNVRGASPRRARKLRRVFVMIRACSLLDFRLGS